MVNCAAVLQCRQLAVAAVHQCRWPAFQLYIQCKWLAVAAVHLCRWPALQLYILCKCLAVAAVHQCRWSALQLYSSFNGQLYSCTLVQMVSFAAVLQCKWLAVQFTLVQMFSCAASLLCKWQAVQLYTNAYVPLRSCTPVYTNSGSPYPIISPCIKQRVGVDLLYLPRKQELQNIAETNLIWRPNLQP